MRDIFSSLRDFGAVLLFLSMTGRKWVDLISLVAIYVISM